MFANKSLSRIFAAILIAGMLLAAQPALPASAVVIYRYVSPLGNDLVDNDCTDRSIPCLTIGYALTKARPSADMIRIAAGTYYEHLLVTKNVALVGAGMGSTIIDGSNTDRVFRVYDTYTVSISNLTIQHGNSGSGGSGGGGIENYGALTLSHVRVADSVATQSGGGVFVGMGQLTMTDSIVSGNQTTNTSSWGGGIALDTSGSSSLSGVTLSDNTAGESGGGLQLHYGSVSLSNVTITANHAKYGAGLHKDNTSTATIANTTIAGNTASGNAGGVMSSSTPGSISLANTIIANNTPNNCAMSGTVTDLGNNIESGSECSFNGSGDGQNIDPLLGALAQNGGLTPTMALLSGSPAVDAGSNSVCAAAPVNSLDQRGITRPQGANCDIGAFESQAQRGPDFLVNALADTSDHSCDTLGQGIGNKDCTLREAIQAANGESGAETITFSLGGTISLASTLPDFLSTNELTIDGTGQSLTISGGHAVRIMIVNGGASLTLKNLTIANGASDAGGAVYNTGTLAIDSSTFSANSVTGAGVGGGIYNSDTLTVTNSTFSGNTASGYGGAIYSTGTLSITNSTLSGNSALLGGGIYNSGTGTATLRNTIVANSTAGGNCGGAITDGGNNLDSGTTCGLNPAAGSLGSTDPMLDALANNGGPTQTFALLAGSPAIDAAGNSVCAAAPVNGLDQRGQSRPYGAACDIGSFEWWQYTISGNAGVAGATLTYTGGVTTSGPTGDFTITVPYGWNGIVTPSKPGYTFSPPNRDYGATPVTANLTGQGFSATQLTYAISGKAADAGVLINYTGGATASDAAGRYSITVPYGWNGVVTPSKTGVSFTPASRSYTNVTADQANQDYVASVSVLSTGAQDGWVLETAEYGSKGSLINNAATTFKLGDDAARRQYRAILSFNSGPALPDGAQIIAVTLRLRKGVIAGGGNPVTIFRGFMLDVRNGSFGTPALQAGDFQAAGKPFGPFKPAPVGGWYGIDLTAAAGYVNTLATGSGLTQIRLRFKLDDNNNAISNTLSLYSGNGPLANRPQLVITYSIP